MKTASTYAIVRGNASNYFDGIIETVRPCKEHPTGVEASISLPVNVLPKHLQKRIAKGKEVHLVITFAEDVNAILAEKPWRQKVEDK